MLIKDYPITNKRRDLVVDIEIEDVQWDNDSIGWYEYCGHMEYDHQPDYVEDFDIGKIYYKNKLIHHKKLYKILCELLVDDEAFAEKVEERAKIEAKEERDVERYLSRL